MKQIVLLDTTLRDGQQCPGAGMTFDENIRYADMMANAMDGGSHIIEAGFPSASKSDYQIVHHIAQVLSDRNNGPEIAALCQLRENQIDGTIAALQPAAKSQKARLHTYFPIDPVLLKASIGLEHDDIASKKKVVLDTKEMIKKSVGEGMRVQFSLEGYSRIINGTLCNWQFGTDLIAAALEGGASVINLPDTIGGGHPREGEKYFVKLMEIHQIIFHNPQIIRSTHNHNDMGLAVANSLNAITQSNVTQVECTMNGVGERAGNASLEEIVMNIITFGHLQGLKIVFDTSKLQTISDFIAQKMLIRQPNKAIVGDNAFRHSSGGHTNAVIDNPLAYQPFGPLEVGGEISMVFGPLSGSNHLMQILERAGITCDKLTAGQATPWIKNFYADRRKGLTDEEVVKAFGVFFG